MSVPTPAAPNEAPAAVPARATSPEAPLLEAPPIAKTPPQAGNPPEMPSARRALVTAAVVSGVVTAVSWLAPKSVAATGVGLVFLAATWFLTIRHDDGDARLWGLSLGGLLDRERIDWGRLAREAATSLLWAALLCLVFFPPFYFGARALWHPRHAFSFQWPASVADDVAGQLFVIALPEEAFFRGYLQTALEAAWPWKVRVLGAELGAGWVVSCAVFAVGHVLTAPSPARLAVFFPALVFGYMRARTKGIGSGVLFHAACNVYSATLGRGFGLPT